MIITTKDTCAGQPRIDGRRITVVNILRFLASGMTMNEIIADYDLNKKQIEEVLLWSASFIEKSFG